MTIKVLGIYGSPRKGGNSDTLLDRALESAETHGASVKRIYVRDLEIAGCRECGGCSKTGKCVLKDPMTDIYPLLVESNVIIVSTPIFFYNMPSELKALVDRTQALWSKRMLEKTREQRKSYDSGRGYLIAAGATKGEKLFEGIELTAKYFYDALDMSYEGGIFFKELESKLDIMDHPEHLQKAYELGRDAVIKK